MRRCVSLPLNTSKDPITNLHPEIDYFADMERAAEAAMRGDFREAERWTGLAERKLSILRRGLTLAMKTGIDKELKPLIAEAARAAPEQADESSGAAAADRSTQPAGTPTPERSASA